MGVSLEAKLDWLLLGKEMVDIPITHILIMKTLEIKQYACCPFNHTHVVDSGKLLRHIAKCKDPSKDNYEQCPYNPLHWVLFAGIEAHRQGKDDVILECQDRGNSKSSFQQVQEQFGQGSNFHNSFISEIPKMNEHDASSEIYRIGLDFEINKPAKNEIERPKNKKINKREMKELNREKLWEEPNFAEWS